MRRKTREVRVGNVFVGGDNPIRIQSMTTSDTKDVAATVEQIRRLEQAGCEIVRMTVQGMKEAKACEAIRSTLHSKGCYIPLVADIHFYPPAAMEVLPFVDKIRINPGNFVDKRALFIRREYDDISYKAEIQKIEEGFAPLVEKCKLWGKSIRIGTNHGSLSDRIMNRYGDTPQGMVESALEFARVCIAHDFHDIIFSMKASNPIVMIEAYRLLCSAMDDLGWDYPLHLGVTEAGEGEDGRIKSAIGIGALLAEGIGDTIRVSLTEDPWCEVDPCSRLQKLSMKYFSLPELPRKEKGNSKQGISIFQLSASDRSSPSFLVDLDCVSSQKGLFTPDYIWIEEMDALDLQVAAFGVQYISKSVRHPSVIPIYTLSEAQGDISSSVIWLDGADRDCMLQATALHPKMYIFSDPDNAYYKAKEFCHLMQKAGNTAPIIPLFSSLGDEEDDVIFSAVECGGLLVDGLCDGVCLSTALSIQKKSSLTFSLLQAARRKTVKTEFISCPGCGRTLFDLQSVSRRIREKTSHLPGVRIAIMGCIVNGPGEMADADFGYVGSRPGKVDLYIGKKCVEKNIDFAEADERLIALIKTQGKWIDPVELQECKRALEILV